jgi:hypothetical protein
MSSVNTSPLNIDEFRSGLSDLEARQFPFAMKTAINNISQLVLHAEKSEMLRVFDRPTQFTQNALKIEYATKQKLRGRVYFKDPPRLSEKQHYLYPNTYGVQRGYKKHEAALHAVGVLPTGYFALPGLDAPLDAFGNMPASLISQILAWFSGFGEQGYMANMTDATRERRRRGTRRRAGFEYIVIAPGAGRLPPGIYKRTSTAFGAALQQMLSFVPVGRVNYRPIYPFEDVAMQIFNAQFANEFSEQLDNAVRTAFP